MVRMKREGVLNFLCDLNTMSPLFTPFHTWCQRYSKDTKPILDNFQKVRNPSKRQAHKFQNLLKSFSPCRYFKNTNGPCQTANRRGQKVQLQNYWKQLLHCFFCERYSKSHLSWYIKNPFGARDSREKYEMHIDHCTYMTIYVLDVKNQFNC